MNVVAYVRVSTDGQVGEDKFGIDNQKLLVQEYCEKHGMNILKWYVDEGISGVKESRPKLDELLYGDICNPPVEAVVVAKSDRVARDIKLYYYFMMLLEKKGMKLISATEEVVNDDTGLGNVYKALMLFVAEQERNNINKRTSGGRRVKASKGGYSGGRPPFGYQAFNKGWVVDEDQAGVVRAIFSLSAGGQSLRKIAGFLNNNEYLTANGKEWSAASVKVILDNKMTYLGYYHYAGSDWVPGQHEAILEEE